LKQVSYWIFKGVHSGERLSAMLDGELGEDKADAVVIAFASDAGSAASHSDRGNDQKSQIIKILSLSQC
jgi:hypothetical protein